MTAHDSMLTDLRQHQVICRELLTLAERESPLLRHGPMTALNEIYEARKTLLPRLADSLEKIRRHRQDWQALTAAARAAQPEINFLVRQVQDLTMRVLHLDRENEQGLLRRGLVPARDVGSVGQQRPHFVADLYRRQQAP